MKKLIIITFFFALTSTAVGEISTRVCLADGNTPLELADPNIPFVYRDIMVDTKLSIIVNSDSGGSFAGGDLSIEGEYRDFGLLSARDYNDTTSDWQGSRFEAAGYKARVYEWEDPPAIHGFNLEGDTDSNGVPGDWFVIDYTATNEGICKVGFYDRSISWDYPIYYHVFSHVRSRDFNKDTKVDFIDFALFAYHWLRTDCGDPDWCEGADLDTNGNVDREDLMFFADYWLEKAQ
jgi:hypothetical protein